jgi:hypothetical protein
VLIVVSCSPQGQSSGRSLAADWIDFLTRVNLNRTETNLAETMQCKLQRTTIIQSLTGLLPTAD